MLAKNVDAAGPSLLSERVVSTIEAARDRFNPENLMSPAVSYYFDRHEVTFSTAKHAWHRRCIIVSEHVKTAIENNTAADMRVSGRERLSPELTGTEFRELAFHNRVFFTLHPTSYVRIGAIFMPIHATDIFGVGRMNRMENLMHVDVNDHEDMDEVKQQRDALQVQIERLKAEVDILTAHLEHDDAMRRVDVSRALATTTGRGKDHATFKRGLEAESGGVCFVSGGDACLASHTVPWVMCGCSSKKDRSKLINVTEFDVKMYGDTERADRSNPHNGMLLTPMLAYLFDRHEITFLAATTGDNLGRIVVSDRTMKAIRDDANNNVYGPSGREVVPGKYMNDGRRWFLAKHNTLFFIYHPAGWWHDGQTFVRFSGPIGLTAKEASAGKILVDAHRQQSDDDDDDDDDESEDGPMPKKPRQN